MICHKKRNRRYPPLYQVLIYLAHLKTCERKFFRENYVDKNSNFLRNEQLSIDGPGEGIEKFKFVQIKCHDFSQEKIIAKWQNIRTTFQNAQLQNH